MSSYCYDCSIKLFGKDFGDFKSKAEGLYVVLCEGCGVIIVDENGKKIEEYEEEEK